MKSSDVLPSDSILLIAAEASSCMYAKNLISQWRKTHPESHFFGVGDHSMENDGMECLGFAEDMAVVGLQEVIKHYSSIKAVADQILKKAEETKPRFALLFDYPGFNLRLAAKLKAMGIPVVYYISPQLWAWKKGRVRQVKDYVDEMLVVFPFEVDFYKQYGIDAHFVGHPLVEVIEQELAKAPEQKHAQPVLGLMPGSRRSEIQHNLDYQLAAAEMLQSKYGMQVRLLLAPTLEVSDVENYLGKYNVDLQILKKPPTQMIQECDFILSASGTATLQVALCEKPMVVMYRMNPITAFIAKLLVNTVDSFCIVNLVAEKKVVPELFQEQASPKKLVAAIEKLLNNSELRDEQIRELKKVKEKLGQGEATKNVVRFLEKRFY